MLLDAQKTQCTGRPLLGTATPMLTWGIGGVGESFNGTPLCPAEILVLRASAPHARRERAGWGRVMLLPNSGSCVGNCGVVGTGSEFAVVRANPLSARRASARRRCWCYAQALRTRGENVQGGVVVWFEGRASRSQWESFTGGFSGLPVRPKFNGAARVAPLEHTETPQFEGESNLFLM